MFIPAGQTSEGYCRALARLYTESYAYSNLPGCMSDYGPAVALRTGKRKNSVSGIPHIKISWGLD